MLTFRELEQDEFKNIPAEALGGYELSPSHRVTAALDGDDVVGIWVTAYALHAEPIWIRPDFRGHPVVIRRLWDGVKGIVKHMGLGGVVGVIPDDVPEDKRIAEWLDAKPLPGKIYLWLEKESKSCPLPS